MHGETFSGPQRSRETPVMMIIVMPRMVMTKMINDDYDRLNFEQEDSVIKCSCLPLFQSGMC